MPEYRHLDSHIEISAENYPLFVSEMADFVGDSPSDLGWNLDVVGEGNNARVTYISLTRPANGIEYLFMDTLAKYVRSGDWIALQPGEYHAQPVPCTLIQFNDQKWSTRETTWSEWCTEIGRIVKTVSESSPTNACECGPMSAGADSWGCCENCGSVII